MTDLSFLDQQALNDWIVAAALVRVQDARGLARSTSSTPCRCAPRRRMLVLCLVEARFPTGTHETYQVPLGLRPAAEAGTRR